MGFEKVGANASEVNEGCRRGTVEVAHEPAGVGVMLVSAVETWWLSNEYRSVVIISLVQVRASDVKVLEMTVTLCSKGEDEADCCFLSHEGGYTCWIKCTSGSMRSPRRAHRALRVTMSPSELRLEWYAKVVFTSLAFLGTVA